MTVLERCRVESGPPVDVGVDAGVDQEQAGPIQMLVEQSERSWMTTPSPPRARANAGTLGSAADEMERGG